MFALLQSIALAGSLVGDSTRFVRINQVGYLPDAPKVAVLCILERGPASGFVVRDEQRRVVLSRARRSLRTSGAFGPCADTERLDFSSVRRPGNYVIEAEGASPVTVRIGADVYAGAADTLLIYLRQQRSGWNPFFHDSVHKLDGLAIDDTGRVVKRVAVSGGWADAADYLQYVTTSATATHSLLLAWRDHPHAFADSVGADGLAGPNGVADVLDEARHGLDWLLRMFPSDTELYNQLADDRDHTYFDLPTNDSADYGWGKGRERPVYPCTGRPQGLFLYRNRSTGLASTAGKYAAAFALAATAYTGLDSAFADSLRRRATAAYTLGRSRPGVCQTAPGRSPYFYEEENWADDMELAAAQLFAVTHERRYLDEAATYAAMEPVTPWMGADTARHYEFYPFHNAGHYQLWRAGRDSVRARAAGYYRQGLERIAARAPNGFRVGVPFIWCSNDLMVSVATQALLYRRMTGDARFRVYEQAAIDWLFGTNPWGTSMVIGYPHAGTWPRDPHSVVASRFGPEALTGGLVDGPVYRSIFGSLRGITLHEVDEFARFNSGFIVYHDDIGDYSTNEPIMDGTASLVYVMAALGDVR
jgi:hypothetical protein